MKARRVLVALDASRPSLEAARTAAELARALGAELVGVFVEDLNLLRLAGLPFAMQVPVLGGAARPVERVAVEQELRALAARARQGLEQAAGSLQVAWSFEVRRGAVIEELLAAAVGAALLVVGSSGQGGRGPGGTTARAAVERSPAPVVLQGPRAAAGRGILVAFDGSPDSEGALAAGAALAPADAAISVCCLAPGAVRAARLAVQARQAAPGRVGEARWAGGASLDELLASARSQRPALLVIAAGSPLLERGGLARLLAAVTSPVLLARQAAG